MRADGEVCAMLNPVQLSIYYYSSSPDPISKADICPGHDARSPGWVDGEMRMSFYWMGGYFHHVIWSLPCEKRRLWKNPKRRQWKTAQNKIFSPRKPQAEWKWSWAWSPLINALIFCPTLLSDLWQIISPAWVSLSAKCLRFLHYAFPRIYKDALSTKCDRKNTKSGVKRSGFKL